MKALALLHLLEQELETLLGGMFSFLAVTVLHRCWLQSYGDISRYLLIVPVERTTYPITAVTFWQQLHE